MNTKCIQLVATLLVYSLPGFSQSKTEQELLALSKKKFDWLTQKKLDSLAIILDERVKYIHSNGWIQNKKEIIDDVASGKLNYTSIAIKSNDVRLYGKTAIVNGTGSFHVTMDGKPLTIELSYTEVYVRKKGKWLLASRHANRLQ
ncbi:MAG: nuclear transport factor 2 family protein [Flammeovirgaceae bacterium]